MPLGAHIHPNQPVLLRDGQPTIAALQAKDVVHQGSNSSLYDTDRYRRRKSKCIRCNPSGDSFQNAIRWILLTAQCFGIMPVIGIGGTRKSLLRSRPSFSWWHVRTLYSVSLVAIGFVETFCCLYQMSEDGISFGNVGALTFYGLAVVSRTLCIVLAKQWPKIIRHNRNVERIFLELPYTAPTVVAASHRGWSLAIRSNIVFGFFVFLAVLEHLFYNFINMIGVQERQDYCKSARDTIELFFRSQRGHLFRYISYSKWMPPLLFWINVCFTMTAAFTDTLIVVTGFSFIMRFNQISDRLRQLERHVVPEMIWMQIRQHYAMLHELLLIMDGELSFIILLSCASSMYFICLQLFNTFNHVYWNALWKTYLLYSLLFTIMRFFTVLLVASTIRDASQKPLKFIYKVASANWNVELTRFSKHIRTGRLALSGRGLFYFTRQLILTVIGTVITYELVMLDEVSNRVMEAETCNGSIYSNKI